MDGKRPKRTSQPATPMAKQNGNINTEMDDLDAGDDFDDDFGSSIKDSPSAKRKVRATPIQLISQYLMQHHSACIILLLKLLLAHRFS